MKNTLKSRVTLFALAATLTMSAQVGAVSVNLLDAEGTWIFTDPTLEGVGTNIISWGTPATRRGQSSYVYTDLAPQSGIPLGSDFKIGKFTHNNNPIYEPALDAATLQIKYNVEVVDGGGTIGNFTGTSVYEFYHWETPNGDNPCADEGPNGSGVNRLGCADRVTFAKNDALSDNFTVDGLTYELALTGFLLGDGSVASEFWTKERRSSTAHILASVTAVPLPAAAPLFASLLGMFGWLRLRSKKNSAVLPA